MPSCLLARARIKLGRAVANFSIQNRRGSAIGSRVDPSTKQKLLSLGYRCLQRGQTFKSSDLVADGT